MVCDLMWQLCAAMMSEFNHELSWLFTNRSSAKGQLNSEWIYEVIVSCRMPTKNLKDFCPGSLLEGRTEIFQIFGWHFRRNDDLILNLMTFNGKKWVWKWISIIDIILLKTNLLQKNITPDFTWKVFHDFKAFKTVSLLVSTYQKYK